MSVIKVKNNGKWETIPIIGSTSGSGVGKVDSNSDGTGEIFNDYENNHASGNYSHVEGCNNIAYQTNSHAEGNNGIAFGNASHVEGLGETKVYGKFNITVNARTKTVTFVTIENYVDPDKEAAIGAGLINHICKFEGNDRLYTVQDSIGNETLQFDTTTGLSNGEVVIQTYNHYAKGPSSHVEGSYNITTAGYSHAEGSNNKTTGSASHVEGSINTVSGNYAHAEGYKNTANGEASHVEGTSNYSLGINSHAEGNNTTARGNYTHSEGRYTTAIGDAAHSEGIRDTSLDSEFFETHQLLIIYNGDSYNNYLIRGIDEEPIRINTGSVFSCNGVVYHVTELEVIQGGQFDYFLKTSPDLKENIQLSLDPNNPTTVTIEPVLKEGTAKGKASHHQNTNNCAYGDNSYAGGQGCQSNNSQSFTHGLGLIASTDNQAVFGKYNKYVPGDIFEVGIGTGKGEESRRNAFRIDEKGNTYFSGKITAYNNITLSSTTTTSLRVNGSATIYGGFISGGSTNKITADYSGTIGYMNNVGGRYSVAFGNTNTVSGYYSGAIGKDCKVNGSSATSFGQDCIAYGNQAHAEGYQTLAIGNYAHAEGGGAVKVDESFYTKTNDEIIAEWKRLYETPTVYETGDGFSMAKGKGSHSEGKNTLALGDYSHAGGNASIAIGDGSFSHGYAGLSDTGDGLLRPGNLVAEGTGSWAGGCSYDTAGISSKSMGSLAFGYADVRSTLMANGYGAIAIGYAESDGNISSAATGSAALNCSTIANNYGQTSIGSFNLSDSTPSPNSLNIEKIAFVIGNGHVGSRGNAFKVLFNGQTYSDGAYSGSGADYAEFFEWKDGNISNEDRVGLFVSLDEDKIVKADFSSSYVLGIVSGNPTIIGDNPMRWKNKYLTDEWGRPIYEDVEVKYIETEVDENGETSRVEKTRIDHVMKINPEWDSSLEYKSRETRPEWSAIGMMGKLLVKQDGTLKAGEFCYPNDNGIATKSESGYYVMKVISENQALILFK